MAPLSPLPLSPALAAALRGSPWHFVITGANGWLGRATLAALRAALGDAFPARVTALGSRPGVLEFDGVTLPVQPLPAWTPPPGAPLLVCHYAFLTMDKVQGMGAQDYVARNVEIRNAVLAWIGTGAVQAALVPSSGAVYDYLRGLEDPALAASRNPNAVLYGRLKHEDEQAFQAACGAHGVRLAMPRVFNLAGPCINKFDAYALASFITQLLQGGTLAIHARRPVLRSYYYIGDLLELCLGLLLRTDTPATLCFDTAADETVELEELARHVIAVLKLDQVPQRAALDPALAPDRYVGDRTAIAGLEQRLGLRPLGLDRQIAATARYIAQELALPLPVPTL
jgi:UDP-glucuronate decarboxylase